MIKIKHREGYRKIMEELRNKMPYPTDIFIEPSPAQYAQIRRMFKENGLVIDAFSAALMRRAWNNCCDEIKKIITEIEEERGDSNSKVD